MAEQQSLLSSWLTIAAVKYLKSRDLTQLLQRYSVSELCQFSAVELRQLGFTDKQIHQVLHPDVAEQARLLNWAAQANNHIICFDDPAYPEHLKQIASPPRLLFTRGDINLLRYRQIAVVGSRSASHYGLDNAYQFSAELARQQFVITSGFASGIDSRAHQGALSVQGKTIAVLGTGVDQVYPKRNIQLAEQIAQLGLLVSEFPPNTPARAQHFPRRNRIISGLSEGVLIVEAALQSGSLITARYAVEQNKEVFAIPSSIHDPRSRGCHDLIKQGAKLTDSVADIIEELAPTTLEPVNLSLDFVEGKNEKKSNKNFTTDALLVNLDYEVTSIDVLVTRSQMPVDVVLTRLLELELEGLVAAVSGGYVRTRRDEYV